MKADESFAKAELQFARRIQEIADPDCLRRVSEVASQAARQMGEANQNVVGADYYATLERVTAVINASVSAIAQEGFQLPFPENVYRSIMSFQAVEMARIDQMAPTAMLDELHRHLAGSNYAAYVASMSEALKNTLIDAADISYLKGVKLSELGTQIINAIDMPRGLISKLDDIHVFTANRLAMNDEISFNLQTKQFVLSDDPEKTSTVEEMNSLSSAAAMFDSLADEKEYVTEEELVDFMNQLEKVQSRASQSSTGQKIDILIRDIVERIGFDRELFYHSRTMADANSCPYTDAQMLMAPAGLPGPGRYNNPGRSYYYFADTLEGTIVELRKHDKKRRIQTAEIKPVKKITMIDLSGTIRNAKTFLRYLRFPLDEQSTMPRVYLIPNYVSDCCRAHDIEGVKYYGSKKYSNYVTWNAGYFAFVRTILEPESDRIDYE